MFWTTAQIADKTGLTQRHVGHLLRNGVIKGQKTGHDWIVMDDDAIKFIADYNQDKEKFQEQPEVQQ